jgi:CheY-like chemotaxis protein
MPYAYVVEDHRDTANCLSQWLRLFNYEVRIALGPLAAIEALAGRVPDVIFIDIHMHGMDGVELCRYIRRDPRTAEVALIAMSSDNNASLAERMRMAGAVGFLAKPLDIQALEDVLRTVAQIRAGRTRPGAMRPAAKAIRLVR